MATRQIEFWAQNIPFLQIIDIFETVYISGEASLEAKLPQQWKKLFFFQFISSLQSNEIFIIPITMHHFLNDSASSLAQKLPISAVGRKTSYWHIHNSSESNKMQSFFLL